MIKSLKKLFKKGILKKILYKNELSSAVPLNDVFKKRKVLEIIGGELNPNKN